MALKTIDLGPVSSYAIAVSKGYTGTEAEWYELIHNVTSNAEAAAGSASSAAQSAAAAAQAVTDVGTAKDAAIAEIQGEGTIQTAAVTAEGATQIANVQSTEESAVDAVEAQQGTSVQAVYDKGVEQIAAVGTAGTTQVGLVQAEGATQIAAVEAKGEEVIESIPEDYTELTDEVNDLKSAVIHSTSNVIWYSGGLSGTAGTQTNNGSRINSEPIDRRIGIVIPTNKYKVAAVAWKPNGEFAGAWDGTQIVSTGLVFSTNAVDLSAIDKTYTVRLVAGKTSDTNVSPSDGANIIFGIDTNNISGQSDETALKVGDMATAHINMLEHLTPRTGYYYNGMTPATSADFVLYPYLYIKAGVTYYFRSIYMQLSRYFDLTTMMPVELGSGWSGSFTPAHDSILALTTSTAGLPNAMLTTSADMYNADERHSVYYADRLYVKDDNLLGIENGNMIPGANTWSGTWNNSGSWTTEAGTYNGLAIKKRTGSWNGLSKAVSIEAGKHYHFSGYVKTEAAQQVQIAIKGAAEPALSTATVSVENTHIRARSAGACTGKWMRFNVEFDCTASGTIHPMVQLTSSGTIYVCGYTLAEGWNREAPVFRCEQDGSADFTKICECVEWGTMWLDSMVYIGDGEYDIVDEFGSAYMEAVQQTYNNGHYLKNRIHLIFSSNSIVEANYEGSNTNTMLNFSPFNSGEYGFTLENLNISASNVRYCVHDERNDSSDQYTSRYIDCKMYLNNTDNTGTTTHQCIGGGLGENGHIIITGGDYEGINATHIPSTGYTPISYHNSWGNGKSHIDIDGVYIHDGSVRLNWYGPSTETTECYVRGCSFTHAIVSGPETQDTSPNQNIEVIAWNNEIRQ